MMLTITLIETMQIKHHCFFTSDKKDQTNNAICEMFCQNRNQTEDQTQEGKYATPMAWKKMNPGVSHKGEMKRDD